MNEKLDYKFGKYDLDFLIKLKAHEFRKQKIDNISEKEIRNYFFIFPVKCLLIRNSASNV